MTTARCLYCYQPLSSGEGDFHSRCSRKFFGTPNPPELQYPLDQVYELANQVVRSSVTVTGVQPKLSMDVETYKQTGSTRKTRFTIVGLWGRYVLKPPTEHYASLPENEDLTMHLAELFKIRTVPHSLLRFSGGELAYITRRVDRPDGRRLAMEDMCQLSERLTEDKYRGSMEQVGKLIRKFSENPGFDLVEFFQVALFSFLTGNADMHLKNFSLLRGEDGLTGLAPAYDLVATRLVIPNDTEETALTINGKKRRLQKKDFQVLAKSLEISDPVLKNIYESFSNSLPQALAFINISFLNQAIRQQYTKLINERAEILGLQ